MQKQYLAPWALAWVQTSTFSQYPWARTQALNTGEKPAGQGHMQIPALLIDGAEAQCPLSDRDHFRSFKMLCCPPVIKLRLFLYWGLASSAFSPVGFNSWYSGCLLRLNILPSANLFPANRGSKEVAQFIMEFITIWFKGCGIFCKWLKITVLRNGCDLSKITLFYFRSPKINMQEIEKKGSKIKIWRLLKIWSSPKTSRLTKKLSVVLKCLMYTHYYHNKFLFWLLLHATNIFANSSRKTHASEGILWTITGLKKRASF